MTQWFVLNLLVATIAAAVAPKVYGLHMVGLSPPYISSRRVGLSPPSTFWMSKLWISVAKGLLDAAIYAIISNLVFWYLWP